MYLDGIHMVYEGILRKSTLFLSVNPLKSASISNSSSLSPYIISKCGTVTGETTQKEYYIWTGASSPFLTADSTEVQ